MRKRNPTSKLMLDRTASIWERYITCTEEFHSSIRWLPKSGWCHAEKSIFCKIERKPVQEEIARTKLWFRAPQSASTGIASCLRWKQMPPSNSHIQNHGKTLLHSLLSKTSIGIYMDWISFLSILLHFYSFELSLNACLFHPWQNWCCSFFNK